MPDVTPERLAEIEDEIRNFPPPTWTAALMVPDLCASLRKAWAERDTAAQEAATLREALTDLWRASAPVAVVGGDGEIERHRALTAARDAAGDVLTTPPTVHAKLAAARQRVCEAGKAWLEHARDAKAAEDAGQDDWYDAYAEDSDALMRALDALAEAEEAAGVKGDG